MNRKRLRMIIDFILMVVFILLYLQHARVLNTALHEILGVVVVFFIIIHVALNWKWVKGTANNWLSSKVNKKSRGMFILSIGLVAAVAFVVISGLAIWLKVGSISITHGVLAQRADIWIWAHIHRNSAMICLGLITIHIWLHKKYIRSFFSRESKR